MVRLVGAGRGRHKGNLLDAPLKLVKHQRAVIKGRREAEAVIHQRVLAGAVTRVHAPYLGDGHVALIDEADEVLREVVKQRIGRIAGIPPIEVAAVVFDAGAKADLAQHLDIITGALRDALGLQQQAFLFKVRDALVQITLDLRDLLLFPLHPRHIVRGRENSVMINGAQGMPCGDLKLAHPLDLIAEKLDPHAVFLAGGRDDLHHVAPHAEHASGETDIVALVLDRDQPLRQRLACQGHTGPQRDHLTRILAGVAHRIDAGDGGHDDHIPPLTQRRRGRVAQAVDLIVNGRVFLNIGIAGGNIRLRLIIIVVADKVLHGAVGKEGAELAAQLRRQCLIVRDDQCGPLHLLDHRGHRKGLARAGHAKQSLRLQPLVKPLRQRLNRLRLITLGLVLGY